MIIITIVMYIIASVISFTPLFLIRGRNALFLKKMKRANRLPFIDNSKVHECLIFKNVLILPHIFFFVNRVSTKKRTRAGVDKSGNIEYNINTRSYPIDGLPLG